MRPTASIAMLLALTCAGSMAARPRRTAAAVAGEVTITFTGHGAAGAGLVDFGSVSHAEPKAPKGKTVRRESITILVSRADGIRGTATLQAWLTAPDPRCIIRVDGIILGNVPVIVDPQVQIGAETVHRIEIEVPVTAANGPLASAIQWEVTTR
jgi:hypothetical protein